MEQGIKNQNLTSTDREKIKVNKKFLIYLFFLLISILLWYLNALSKDYTTFIRYPVKYENFPKDKVLVSDLPQHLSFKVRGFGFNILKYKLWRFTKSVTISIDDIRAYMINKDNQYVYYLPTRYAKELISAQLNNDIQLLDIFPDTLVLGFADVVEKKLPVQAILDVQYEKQYMQNGKLVVKPDSVIVSGPQIIVDTLRYINTTLLKEEDLKDTLSEEVKLKPISKLSYHTSTVNVTLPVEKFTEMTISVPIETENAPEGLRVRTFPSSIKVSYRIGVSSYDKITPFMFRAMVDYNALIINQQNKAKVNLVKYPSVAQDIQFHPKSVDYIIEK